MKTVYKIVSPVFCVLLFPIFYFLPLIRIHISSSLSETLMSNIGLKENMSLQYIISSLNDGSDVTNSFIKTLISSINDKESVLGKMFTNTGWLYAAIVCFIVSLVITLVVIGFSAFSKKYVLSTCLTGGAMVTLFAANKLFDAFAAPMLSGKISIGSLLSSASASESAGLLGGLLGNLAKLDILHLGISYQAAMFSLGIALILGICAIVEARTEKK